MSLYYTAKAVALPLHRYTLYLDHKKSKKKKRIFNICTYVDSLFYQQLLTNRFRSFALVQI